MRPLGLPFGMLGKSPAQGRLDIGPRCIYNLLVRYDWDERKRTANLAKHGVDFNEALDFDWHSAIEALDDRHDYSEHRWVALGPIHGRLHALVYMRRSETIRVISLRRANARERRFYETRQET